MGTTLEEVQKRTTQSRQNNEFDSLLNREYRPRSFDPDAFHAMQSRDEQLIRDSILHGTITKDYIYSFSIQGTPVTGISVIGARQLAVEYKGIKSRLRASTEKTGSMFIFRSYDPPSISVQNIPELADQTDFYECVVEVSDIKTGNSIEARKKENKVEFRKDRSTYIRPHFDVIAESKAFRNGVLSIIPQDVIGEFERKALAAGNESKEQTIQQRRDALMAYSTKHGIRLERQSLSGLSYSELDGIGDAARAGKEEFKSALTALNLIQAQDEKPESKPESKTEPKPDKKESKPQQKPSPLQTLLDSIAACKSTEGVDEVVDMANTHLQGGDITADERKTVVNAAGKRITELEG